MARAFRSSGFRSTKSFSKMSSGSKGVKAQTSTKAKVETKTSSSTTSKTESHTSTASGYTSIPTTNLVTTNGGNSGVPWWYFLWSQNDKSSDSKDFPKESTKQVQEPTQSEPQGFSICEVALLSAILVASTWYVCKKFK